MSKHQAITGKDFHGTSITLDVDRQLMAAIDVDGKVVLVAMGLLGVLERTDNPRQLRVLQVLLAHPLTREQLDKIAGCSNGPDLVNDLRRRGLEIPCQRIQCIDCDGEPCRPGDYSLLAIDQKLIDQWMAQRGRGRTECHANCGFLACCRVPSLI